MGGTAGYHLDIAGPWKRYGEETPSPIEQKFIENPIVKEIGGYFVVIYDSGIIKGENEYQNDPIQVGYSVSINGLDWPTGARIAVRDISDKENWAEDVRTPLGLIPMEDGTYSLLYTAKKKGEQFWAIGVSRVRIVQNPSEVKSVSPPALPTYSVFRSALSAGRRSANLAPVLLSSAMVISLYFETISW